MDPKVMTSHELAALLQALPDVKVVVPNAYGREADFAGVIYDSAEATIKLQAS